MVLQHGKPAKLWGKASPGSKIRAALSAVTGAPAASAVTTAGLDGAWSLYLPPGKPGKTVYTLTIEDDTGECITIRDVVIGTVWFAGGQSNMDLMMTRVRDRYPSTVRDADAPFIRTFKIDEHTSYGKPLAEPVSGAWRCASADSILDFSATGFFFAKALQEMTDVPVGFIHASLGGSLISCWMSKEMLSEPSEKKPGGYPELLEEAKQYAAPGYIAGQLKHNESRTAEWNKYLSGQEWINREKLFAGLPAGSLTVPCFFRDIPKLQDFCGCLTLMRRFVITEEMLAGEGRIRLFLGTITDRDEVYVNGVQVGSTGYQYPPRKYEVPLSALRVGENDVEIRMVVEHRGGRLTPGKEYTIFRENDIENTDEKPTKGRIWQVDLTGEWQYQVRAICSPMPDMDFVNWHPTGLYNGMTAPCHNYTIDGLLWYQGESNADRPEDYRDLQLRMIRGLRKAWGDDTLPFLYVQLPNFTIDLTDEREWPQLREKQRLCLSEPHTGMVCAIDLGEDNDLHPTGKKEIGRRLALLAAAERFGSREETSGPVVERVEAGRDGRVFLYFSHGTGIHAEDKGRGGKVSDFVVIDWDDGRYPATVEEIDPSARRIQLKVWPGLRVREVRYIDSNTYKGALICGGTGLPMAPFRVRPEV